MGTHEGTRVARRVVLLWELGDDTFPTLDRATAAAGSLAFLGYTISPEGNESVLWIASMLIALGVSSSLPCAITLPRECNTQARPLLWTRHRRGGCITTRRSLSLPQPLAPAAYPRPGSVSVPPMLMRAVPLRRRSPRARCWRSTSAARSERRSSR